jgi:hypothetical protein
MCDTAPWPDGQLHSVLKVEERDGTMLKFLSDYSLGGQTQSIPIKGKRAFEIIYAEGDYGDMRFHGFASAEHCNSFSPEHAIPGSSWRGFREGKLLKPDAASGLNRK